MNKPQNKKAINYIYSEEFKRDDKIMTEEELKDIFNDKYFKTIIKMEKDVLKD